MAWRTSSVAFIMNFANAAPYLSVSRVAFEQARVWSKEWSLMIGKHEFTSDRKIQNLVTSAALNNSTLLFHILKS